MLHDLWRICDLESKNLKDSDSFRVILGYDIVEGTDNLKKREIDTRLGLKSPLMGFTVSQALFVE